MNQFLVGLRCQNICFYLCVNAWKLFWVIKDHEDYGRGRIGLWKVINLEWDIEDSHMQNTLLIHLFSQMLATFKELI